MIENLQWFFAVMLMIAAAVGIGAAFWWAVDIATGGLGRAKRAKRCAMPKRLQRIW